jgi:small subunit ribosomal protein S19e
MTGSATGRTTASVREVPPDLFVQKLSRYLEANHLVAVPEWADLVKTGCLKQMPPSFQNWWYTRAASIARQVYLHPQTSVTGLRNRYGSKKHYGVAPCHFCKSSGKIVRVILKELTELGWIQPTPGDLAVGRQITPKGQKQLDLIAQEVNKDITN